MERNRVICWAAAFILAVAVRVVMAADGHGGHGEAVGPCADREAPAALRCALAPTGVFDGRGRLWVVWALGGHVYVNYSDDQGRTFSTPVSVNRIPERVAADGENRPKIAVGPEGEVYVSWTQRLERPYSGHIRFARSGDGGRTFSEPVIVNDHQAVTSHRFDSLGVNRRGEVYLAWLDKRDQMAAQGAGGRYAGAALYFTLSRDGGRTFLPNRKIADHTCECCRTAMALGADGLPVIAWRHIYDDNIRDHALVRFDKPDAPAAPVRLSHDHWRIEACPHHGPALSVSEGAYHAVWFNNAPERHGLFYARSGDGGQTFSQPLAVGNYEAAASHPAVASLGRRVWIAWQEFDGTRTQVLAMHSDNNGETWSAPIVLAATAGKADHPQLLHDSKVAFVTWQTEQEGFHLLPADGGKTP